MSVLHDLVVPGGRLTVAVDGDRQPAIVFLHGFSLDRRSWAAQVARFAADHRCIAYDLRGFGDSTLPEGDYDHASDLAAVIDRFAPGGAIVVGLSLGANVALAHAARHPGQVRGLVLAASGLIGHDWGTQERPPAAADRVAQQDGVAAARAFWLAHPLFATLHGDGRAQVEQMVGDYSGWHWAAPGRGARIASPGALSGIAAPTLVMSGDRDIGGYRDIAAILAGAIPDAHLVRLPGVGHMINLEAPAAFDDHLATFIATLAKGATR